MNIINKHGLDPVTMYETLKIKLMLTREEIAVPEQEDDEDDQQYRERLIQVRNVVVLQWVSISIDQEVNKLFINFHIAAKLIQH